jgi:hypothetical protein
MYKDNLMNLLIIGGSGHVSGTVQQSSPATYANLIVDAWVPE